MKEALMKEGYVLDAESRIWRKADFSGIAYTDGDEVEKQIENVIENAIDLSVLSDELREYCIDWPSLYHLSGTRANLIRPLRHILKGDILEIGSGCGAITRYLGECGGNVLALEGSPQRAKMTRSRTRDLKNVTVLAESFDDYRSKKKFDVITLIGVLEYANLFINGDNPALVMLEKVSKRLKPNGKLILAIENQLGLKYLAGALEDHLGQPMVGIENRYRNDQPRTFGREVLAGMLNDAGFQSVELLTPFPDYKLPTSVITENGFANSKFDAAAFASQCARSDPQLPVHSNFSLELVWPECIKNGLGPGVANSFLFVSSLSKKTSVDANVLAYHYSSSRLSKYCKEVQFKVVKNNKIKVFNGSLDYQGGEKNKHDDFVNFYLDSDGDYVSGELVSWGFIGIVTKDGWTLEEVGGFFSLYISILRDALSDAGKVFSLNCSKEKLPGSFFDFIPQNIVRDNKGEYVSFDQEWGLKGGVELGYLLFRILYVSINSITKFGESLTCEFNTRLEFIQAVFESLDLTLSSDDVYRFIGIESSVQKQVTGKSSSEQMQHWLSEPLPQHSIYRFLEERDQEINAARDTINQLAAEIERARESHQERDEAEDLMRASLQAREQEVDAARDTINQLAAEIEQSRQSHFSRDEIENKLQEKLSLVESKLKQIKQSYSYRLLKKLRIIR